MKLNFWIDLAIGRCNRIFLVVLTECGKACLGMPKLMTHHGEPIAGFSNAVIILDQIIFRQVATQRLQSLAIVWTVKSSTFLKIPNIFEKSALFSLFK